MAGKIVLDVHILVDKYSTASEGHYIAEIVKSNIYHNIENIKDITVHVDVTNHEDGVIKLENFEPSRIEILSEIKEIFAQNNIDESNILDKKMSIYYFENEILVDLYVKRSNDLKRLSKMLSNLSVNGYNTNVSLYCHLADS